MKKVKWLTTILVMASIALGIIGCSSPSGSGNGGAQGVVVPEGFVLVKGTTITGTESWTPESEVFVNGRNLTIPDLIVSDHEVTRGEYKDVMGSDPSTASAYDKDGKKLEGDDVLNNPVNYVNWYDALVYCNKRSMEEKLTPCYSIGGSTDPKVWGVVPTSSNSTWNAVECDWNANGYRLPTEAEWEYAARAGDNTVDSLTYSGTSNVDELGDYAWYYNSANDNTHEVGTKEANAFCLYDMSGNVWEWCWNWFTDSYDTTTEGGSDPTGTSDGSDRVLRGGGWGDISGGCAVSYRNGNNPSTRNPYIGFRVVRNAK